MDLLQERFGTRLGAVTSLGRGARDFDGIIDLVRMKGAPLQRYRKPLSRRFRGVSCQAEEAHDHLCELVAEADDELKMKYLEGEETLTQEERRPAGRRRSPSASLCRSLRARALGQGVSSLMDDIATYFRRRPTTARCRLSTAIRSRFQATMIVRWRLCLRPGRSAAGSHQLY